MLPWFSWGPGNSSIQGIVLILFPQTFRIQHWKDSLQWRHNERDGVSNHQPHGCLFKRLFKAQIKKTSKLRVTGLCEGSSPVTGEFPHKGPVPRKMFPFDDVIMFLSFCKTIWHSASRPAACETRLKSRSRCIVEIKRISCPGVFTSVHTCQLLTNVFNKKNQRCYIMSGIH